jgi:hypothetical protein
VILKQPLPPPPFFVRISFHGSCFAIWCKNVILNGLERIRFRAREKENDWHRIRNKCCWEFGRSRRINFSATRDRDKAVKTTPY